VGFVQGLVSLPPRRIMQQSSPRAEEESETLRSLPVEEQPQLLEE
jgi:hypothetical protein